MRPVFWPLVSASKMPTVMPIVCAKRVMRCCSGVASDRRRRHSSLGSRKLSAVLYLHKPVRHEIGGAHAGRGHVDAVADVFRDRRAVDLATVELDLRTPNGLRRSHLLHQLVALGVPWGSIEDGRGSSFSGYK